MHFFWCRLFPVALVACASALAVFEFRYPFLEGRSSRRRVIRLTGSGLMCAVGVMIWFGQLPGAVPLSPVEAWSQLRYWGIVLGLLMLLVLLACADSIDGARALKRYLEGVEREEVERIRRHLSND